MERVFLRLYRIHDLDLVALYKTKEFNFIGAAKEIVKNYAKGNLMQMKMPPVTTMSEEQFSSLKGHYVVCLNFDEKEDAEVVQFIKKIRPRFKNGAIKTILRNSLIGGLSSIYFENAEQAVINNNMNSILSSDIEDNNYYKPTKYRKKYDPVLAEELANRPKKKRGRKKKIDNVDNINGEKNMTTNVSNSNNTSVVEEPSNVATTINNIPNSECISIDVNTKASENAKNTIEIAKNQISSDSYKSQGNHINDAAILHPCEQKNENEHTQEQEITTKMDSPVSESLTSSLTHESKPIQYFESVSKISKQEASQVDNLQAESTPAYICDDSTNYGSDVIVDSLDDDNSNDFDEEFANMFSSMLQGANW